MRYFLIAGEASGDLHGANLVRELRTLDQEAELSCWGGDLMEAEGAILLKHYSSMAFMGVWEVIKNLSSIRKNLKKCKSDIVNFKPDVVILIDYPGFNLRMAKYLKGRIKNIYYFISPKIWAWKKSRIKLIRAYIDRMYVILPFETEFYKNLDYQVKYYGNPLVETVNSKMSKVPSEKDFRKLNNLDDKPIIALLAGSRDQEIRKMLPEMIKVSEYYLDYQFVIAGVRSVSEDLYIKIVGSSEVKVIFDQTYSLYKFSKAAIITSGTATLEAAISGIPQVVCYKTSKLTYILAKSFLKIRFISLVNLIMDKEVVKELIQDRMVAKEIVEELNALLPGGWKRSVMKADYSLLSKTLDGNDSSKRIAGDLYNSLRMLSNVN